MNHFLPREEALKRLAHPCDTWAQSAKHENWLDAVQAMMGGQVLCGRAPRMGKSAVDFTLFYDRVYAEGLHAYATDIGQVFLGLKENFSPAMLEHQRRESEVFARLYSGPQNNG